MSRFRNTVRMPGRAIATATLAVSLAASPLMVERIANACDKGADVQTKSSFFSSEKLNAKLGEVKGDSVKEKLESLFNLLKVGNGFLKFTDSHNDKRAPNDVTGTLENGGDCTELGFVTVASMKQLGIDGGVAAVTLEGKDKKKEDHLVAFAYMEVDGKKEKFYLDPRAEKAGEIKGAYKLLFEMTLDEAESIYHREMGNYYLLKGKNDDALKEFEKAEKIFYGDAYVHHILGILYQKKGEYKKAEEHNIKAAELEPGNEVYKANAAVAVYNKEFAAGVEAFNSNDYKSAKKHFENALNSGVKLSKEEKKMLENNIKACEQNMQ